METISSDYCMSVCVSVYVHVFIVKLHMQVECIMHVLAKLILIRELFQWNGLRVKIQKEKRYVHPHVN